jgi:hypothetical protein
MGTKVETPTDGFVRLSLSTQLFMTGREVYKMRIAYIIHTNLRHLTIPL